MLRSARAQETAQSEAALMRLATFSLDNAHSTTNYTGTPSFIARPSSEMSGTLLICIRNLVHCYFQNDDGE